MATKKIKDLAVKIGTYEKGGETKNRYINIGCILEKDDGGKFMLLERTFNPAGVPNPEGKETLLVSMFDVNGEKNQAGNSQPQKQASNAMDDEIPF